MVTSLFLTLAQSAVVFADGFESGDLANWGDNRGTLSVVSEGAYEGKRCIKFTGEVGQGEGAHIVKWFMPGYNEIAVRWAVKFSDDFDQGNHMHLCAIGGNRTDNKWSSMGQAGKLPTGTDFFVTNLEPWSDWGRNPKPGRLMFYSYWPDMKKSPDGMYWGNNLLSDPPIMVPRGKWVVMSLWIRLNKPGMADGEQAFWMDGVRGGHWKGVRFRDSDVLRLNSLSLDLYLHDSKKVNVAWFDDVVVSREKFAWMKL